MSLYNYIYNVSGASAGYNINVQSVVLMVNGYKKTDCCQSVFYQSLDSFNYFFSFKKSVTIQNGNTMLMRPNHLL